MDRTAKKHRLALVLSGGGARGAYEAGVVHYIRTQLPKSISLNRRFNLLCGSSVGAINTCFIASTSHDLKAQGELIYSLWQSVQQDNIYRRNIQALTQFMGRSVSGISKNLLGFKSEKKRGHFVGLLDTIPFHGFLKRIVDWDRLHKNIQNRITDAVSLTATNMRTNRMELFVDKHDGVEYTGHYPVHFGPLQAEHARASAAIPIIFPTVQINGISYSDGGLRLNTPLSPAIQLGADRLLVVGLHPIRSGDLELLNPTAQVQKNHSTDSHLPSLGEIIGTVLNSLFLDHIDYDIEQLARINRVIEWGEMAYGPDFLKSVNKMLVDRGIRGDIANRGLKRLKALSIFPSESLSGIFSDCLSDPKLIKAHLGSFEKVLLRLLDVDLTHGQNFLSYLMFIPEYIKRLLDLGFEDAKTHRDEIIAFFEEEDA